jgi:Transcription factor WhiB
MSRHSAGSTPRCRGCTPGARDAWDTPSAEEKRAAEYACRLICSVCPVRLECTVGALERREPNGIWGGLDRADRKALPARYGYLPPGDPPAHGTNSSDVGLRLPRMQGRARLLRVHAPRPEAARAGTVAHAAHPRCPGPRGASSRVPRPTATAAPHRNAARRCGHSLRAQGWVTTGLLLSRQFAVRTILCCWWRGVFLRVSVVNTDRWGVNDPRRSRR